ncbi:hypothetical protein KP509_24G061600 [Ceratopteris richardii]|nr:hypothetical protein KP509_24G061600 [Ceratopteris richardii]
MEKSKANLLQDLARTKRQLEDMNAKLQTANKLSKMDRLRAEEMEHASFTAAEDFQAELEAMKEQYEAALLDLQTNKQAMENLKHELFLCIEAKDEAVRLAGEAMNAAESTAKRVEEMSAELLAAKGSTHMSHMASDGVDEMIVEFTPKNDLGEAIFAEELKDLLTCKEIELQKSLQEASQLRSEVEILKQELALAQKSVEQQMSHDKNMMELSDLIAAREIQLQNAPQEAIHFKPVLGSLKEELSATHQLSQEKTIHEKGTNNAAVLVGKETEVQNGIMEVSQYKAEPQTWKQDLVPAKALVEEQAEDVSSLLNHRESELQNALLGLDYFKSETEHLKQELALMRKSVVQEGCFQGSQKEVTVLLASKGVQLQSDLQEATDLRPISEHLKEECTQAQYPATNQTGLPDVLLEQAELGVFNEGVRDYKLQLMNTESEIDRLDSELQYMKSNEHMLKVQLKNAVSDLESLKNELAAVNEVKERAVVAASATETRLSKLEDEVVKAKESELVALKALSDLSSELKQTQESLAEASQEASVLGSLIEPLKAGYKKVQLELADVEEKEALANEKVQSLGLELTKVIEASKEELKSMSDQLASAQAVVDSLKADEEKQRQELHDLKRKESLANQKVIDITERLHNSENELRELKRQQLNASKEQFDLVSKLEANLREISELKKKDFDASTQITHLTQAFQEKVHEIKELEEKVVIADNASTSLISDLRLVKAEVLELQERESCANTKASALSVILASLLEKNEAKLKELRKREVITIAKFAKTNEELTKTRSGFEEALTAAKSAKDEKEKLQASSQAVTLEAANVTQEKQKVSAEVAQTEKDADGVLIDLQETKIELEMAQDALYMAELGDQKQPLEVHTLMLDLQRAENEILQLKGEVEFLNNKLRLSTAELRALRGEMEQLRQEAQIARKDAELLQNSITTEREQGVFAKNEAQMAWEEVMSFKKEMYTIKRNQERAQSSCGLSEDRLKDATVLNDIKEIASDHPTHHEDSISRLNCTSSMRNMQPSDAENDFVPSDESLEQLKVKMQQTEEKLALALKEIEKSQFNTHTLLINLETMKLEKEANEKTFQEVCQLLADTENAKSNLEAEIQRLLDESKQWQTAKDAVDIPIHAEAVSCVFSSDCRDDKPQPDSPNEALDLAVSLPSKGVNVEEEPLEREESVMRGHSVMIGDFASLSMRREDSSEKEEAPFCDVLLSMPTKKKKKTLFVRLGTLLEKKKHSTQYTP